MGITVVKGQRADVTKPHPGLARMIVSIGWDAPAQLDLDTSAFLLGASGKVSGDADLIFYNNPSNNFIKYADARASRDKKQFAIRLENIPASVEKIAITLTIYDGEKRGQSFSQVRDLYLRIENELSGQELLRFELDHRFTVETAIVIGELYRHNGEWKFNAIGSGFSDGLSALCANFGIAVEDKPDPKPEPKLEPTPEPKPEPKPELAPIQLGKIELKKKGDKINLQKQPKGLGEILINLNWNHSQGSGGLFRRSQGIDLDLACLYELKNGKKGLIQALGNSFGSLAQEPYISLDGDDRTGHVQTGENLRINGAKLQEFKRLLVFAFIYEGVTRWSDADGVVTIKQEGGPDIVVHLNEHDNRKPMCAIALIQNAGDETLSIERLVQYHAGHRDLDQAFGWGLRWVAGHK